MGGATSGMASIKGPFQLRLSGKLDFFEHLKILMRVLLYSYRVQVVSKNQSKHVLLHTIQDPAP